MIRADTRCERRDHDGFSNLDFCSFNLPCGPHKTAGPHYEGGVSHYLPGTYNDFAAGVSGPSGLYFRNDFFAYHGKISKAPIGGRLFNDVDQRVWMDSFKFTLLTDWEFIGARYGATVTVPVMLYGFAEGFLQLEQGQQRRQDDRTGIGDLYLAPIQLNWRWPDHHLTFSQGVYLPHGLLRSPSGD